MADFEHIVRSKKAEREEQEKTLKEFLRKGGSIRRVERGASGWKPARLSVRRGLREKLCD